MGENITFELGNFHLDASSALSPAFDPEVVTTSLTGDILLQYKWNRQQHGKWDNLFLFETDATSINDLSNSEVKYYTIKGNWCSRKIPTTNVDGFAIPQLSNTSSLTNASPAVVNTTAVGLCNDAGVTYGQYYGFDRTPTVGAVNGYLNKPNASKIKSYNNAGSIYTNNDNSITTHLNLAGDYVRYFAYKIFGNNLGPGLDIFSNETEMINDVKKTWNDPSINNLSTQIHDAITGSNAAGPAHIRAADSPGSPGYTMDKTMNNFAHNMLTSLVGSSGESLGNISAASGEALKAEGIKRLICTLSHDPSSNLRDVSSAEYPQAWTAGFGIPSNKLPVVDENTGVHKLNAGRTLYDGETVINLYDRYYRLPLKINDKIRISFTVNDKSNHALGGAVPSRKYIVEYILTDETPPGTGFPVRTEEANYRGY